MLTFIIRRLLWTVLVLFVITVVVFIMARGQLLPAAETLVAAIVICEPIVI